MPKRIKKIEVDINKKDTSMKFFAKQYEDICVEAAITDGGTIVDFTNCIIEWHSDLLEGVPIINTKGNKIKLIFNASSLKKVGMCTAELVIKDNDGTIKTPNFYFYISKSISGEVSVELKILRDSEGNRLIDSNGNILKVRW
ncbi:MAG: BppU family phage baseplate upper protein [Clostridium sp.]|nr:BppU family phage baseplate upper protein [Clostridium sp.]